MKGKAPKTFFGQKPLEALFRNLRDINSKVESVMAPYIDITGEDDSFIEKWQQVHPLSGL